MTQPELIAPSVPVESDRALMQRVAEGDRIAFELLMRRHNRRLFRVARSVLRDARDAEDALQDAYLQIFRSAGQFRGEAALSTWLTRLVLNECLGRTRRQARRQNVIPMVRSPDEAELNSMPSSDTDQPDNIVARSQIRAFIEQKLDELPEIFRTVFVLRSVEELSVGETALCLGITEGTVRTRHFRAMSMMREALAREVDHAERDLYDFGGERCNRVVSAVFTRLQAPS